MTLSQCLNKALSRPLRMILSLWSCLSISKMNWMTGLDCRLHKSLNRRLSKKLKFPIRKKLVRLLFTRKDHSMNLKDWNCCVLQIEFCKKIPFLRDLISLRWDKRYSTCYRADRRGTLDKPSLTLLKKVGVLMISKDFSKIRAPNNFSILSSSI